METIDDEVERIQRDALAPSTRAKYERELCKMVLWFAETSPQLLNPAVYGNGNGCTTENVAKVFSAKPFVSPLKLEALQALDFERYVVASHRTDGKPYGKATYSNMRSSLVYLFSLSGARMEGDGDEKISRFCRCLNRTSTRASQESNERLTIGKEPLSFSLYREVCAKLMQVGSKDCVFAHVFLVITWNLICRAANASSIRYKHMSWKEDALAIMFAHMKNDQEGERARDARHIYANPSNPTVCPILSLGVYFVTMNFDSKGRLFPGGSQDDRYGKVLRRILETEDMVETLATGGLTPQDFGSHSARKGAATYVSSCSTAGPSAAAICLRAGWTLPGIQDTYIRYESAGDQIVGRFVSGLPHERGEFATLPPFFESTTTEVMDAVRACFPGAPPSMIRICEYALASLCYHSDFLLTTLPPQPPVFACALFRHPRLLARLRSMVMCRNSKSDDRIRSTGIPPHVSILAQMETLADKFEESTKRLEQRVISTFQDAVQQISGHQIHVTAPVAFVTPVSQPNLPSTRPWHSEFRRMPSNFKLQNGAVSLVWQYWCCGDDAKCHPPYRLLRASDFTGQSGRSQQKRLTDMRSLFAPVERELKETGQWNDQPTPAEAAKWFPVVQRLLAIEDTTLKGRRRRPDTLSWLSVLRDVSSRKHNSALR